jgi:asparagine synthase (glutamine-hydrolysing)
MCGIAGFAGGFLPGLMADMNEAQAHRGPDARGVFEDRDREIALGHVRLSILDLSDAAAQPMHSPDDRFVLVYNGEIYNFTELREELTARGYMFRSTGDTEVLLHGWLEFGEEFLKKVNGIFAFAIWDRREQELWLARDMLGVKPLYYTLLKKDELLFASEIKALCAHPDFPREPDFDAIQQHLAYCHASAERTALKGVRRLPPGHRLRWRREDRSKEVKGFWRPPFGELINGDGERPVKELRHLLQTAILRQMVSDVPVGSFLSGGLDSSVITTIASQNREQRFECFTITYPAVDNQLDRFAEDAPYARRLSRQLDLSLHEIKLSPNLVELLPKLIYHLDEPIADPAIIPCYLICKLARERGTTVLLSGQGGDELFCGYPRYPVMYLTQWIDHLHPLVREMISRSARLLPGAFEGGGGAFLRRIRRALGGLEHTADERFLGYCAYAPQEEITGILSSGLRDALGGREFTNDCLQHMEGVKLFGMQRLQERDLSIYLPNHNLLYTDKMSMAVGVEVRVPLLDLKVVERVLTFPYKWQLAGRKTKVLFREASRGIVPDEIIERPKAGLGAPFRKWLRYDLKEMWLDLTSEETVRRRGWFNYKALQDIRSRSQAGKDDLYMLQWAVFTIELWARQFMDRSPANQSTAPENFS